MRATTPQFLHVCGFGPVQPSASTIALRSPLGHWLRLLAEMLMAIAATSGHLKCCPWATFTVVLEDALRARRRLDRAPVFVI